MQIIVRDLNLLSNEDLVTLKQAKGAVVGADVKVPVNTPRSADPEDYVTVGVHGMPGCTVTVPGCEYDDVVEALAKASAEDPRPKLWLDIETYSVIPLKSASDGDGTVYRYAEDESFRLLCASYAVDDGEVHDLEGHDEILTRLAPALLSNDVVKYAHNAQFERICFSYALRKAGYLPDGKFLDPGAWEDTQAHNLTHGLPASLKQGAKALGGEEKDDAGARLISLFCKPNKKGERNRPENYPREWTDFVRYCNQDVVSMRDMSDRLRARYGRLWWTDLERRVWVEDQRINDRGVALDLDLAEAGKARDAQLKVEAVARIKELTGIDNPNSGPQWKAWLVEQRLDHVFPDLQKGTINAKLDTGELSDRPDVEEALRLKLIATSKSASKFAAALAGVSSDGRYRGAFQFHKAHTGRWSGKGLQLHNLNHDKFYDGDAEDAFDVNLRMTQDAAAQCKAGEPLDGKSLGMLVRPMLTGPFSIADYTGVEALTTGWLSGEQWVVDTFAAGEDIYVATGRQAGGLGRKEGKVMVLACGFSGGVGAMRRFSVERVLHHDQMRETFDAALAEGAVITESDGEKHVLSEADWPALRATWEDQEIQGLVNTWRAANRNTVAFWDRLTMAVKHGGTAGEHIWVTKNDAERVVHLPSGRCLVYHNVGMGRFPVNVGTAAKPEVEWKAGLHRYQWGAAFGSSMWRGLLTENVVQATARDFLAAALVRLADAGVPVVSHVHDEILIEDCDGSLEETLADLMAADVEWAPSLPLSAGSYRCPVYVKD